MIVLSVAPDPVGSAATSLLSRYWVVTDALHVFVGGGGEVGGRGRGGGLGVWGGCGVSRVGEWGRGGEAGERWGGVGGEWPVRRGEVGVRVEWGVWRRRCRLRS